MFYFFYKFCFLVLQDIVWAFGPITRFFTSDIRLSTGHRSSIHAGESANQLTCFHA